MTRMTNPNGRLRRPAFPGFPGSWRTAPESIELFRGFVE